MPYLELLVPALPPVKLYNCNPDPEAIVALQSGLPNPVSFLSIELPSPKVHWCLATTPPLRLNSLLDPVLPSRVEICFPLTVSTNPVCDDPFLNITISPGWGSLVIAPARLKLSHNSDTAADGEPLRALFLAVLSPLNVLSITHDTKEAHHGWPSIPINLP